MSQSQSSDSFSSDTQREHPRRHSPVPFLIALIVLIALAATLYFGMVRDNGPKPLKLALVTWTQDPFWDPLVRGAQDCAAQSNVQLTIVKSEPTVEAQNKHLDEMMKAGVDGIAVSPNDAQAQATELGTITDKMPVVTFDTDAPQSKRRRFVGIDNYAAGLVAAGEVREALPDGGPVLISVGSATMQHGRDRRQGLIDGLLERGFDRDRAADPIEAPLSGPKYSIVATVTDGGDPAKAVPAIADALKAHPEVKAIVGLFSYSAPAALEAMKQTGREGQIKVVGFDEADETQAGLASGAIHSSILQDSYRAGYEAIQVLANEARSVARGPAESSPALYVRVNVLTADNLPEMRESKAIREPKNGPAMPTTSPTTKPAG